MTGCATRGHLNEVVKGDPIPESVPVEVIGTPTKDELADLGPEGEVRLKGALSIRPGEVFADDLSRERSGPLARHPPCSAIRLADSPPTPSVPNRGHRVCSMGTLSAARVTAATRERRSNSASYHPEAKSRAQPFEAFEVLSAVDPCWCAPTLRGVSFAPPHVADTSPAPTHAKLGMQLIVCRSMEVDTRPARATYRRGRRRRCALACLLHSR